MAHLRPLKSERSSELEWEVGVTVFWRSGLWGAERVQWTDTQGSAQHSPKSWGLRRGFAQMWKNRSKGDRKDGMESGKQSPRAVRVYSQHRFHWLGCLGIITRVCLLR